MSLFDAVAKNDYNLVKELIKDKNVNINETTAHGETPLMVASQKGHLSICELLISNGADVNSVDEYGRIPLHLASENNHFLVCKLLIESGADVNHKDINKQTPIIAPIENKNYKILHLLLKTANTTSRLKDKNLLEDLAYSTASDIGIKKNLEFFDLDSPSQVDENSPRVVYDRLVHRSQITMLGSEFGPVFKIRIEHPDIYQLFEKYKNLSENPMIDCVFQVLFGLGLREVNAAKRDSAVINKLGKYNKATGVNVDDLNEYLEQIFDLRKNSLLSIYYKEISRSHFKDILKDGLATIIVLNFDTHAHCVGVFRSGKMVWFFDPQNTNKKGEPVLFEYLEIEDYYPNIDGFYVIHLNPDITIEDKPLRIEKCNLPIFAKGNNSKSKKKKSKGKKSKGKKTKKQKNKRN